MKRSNIFVMVPGLLALLLLALPARGTPTPYFITQPVSQTNYAGDTVTFSVVAGGGTPLSYQWQKNSNNLTDGGIISGSTTSNLTLTGIAVADYGNYSVTVTNTFGKTSSTNAALTVYARLVQNGGFETGDFSDWSISGRMGGFLISSNSSYVHSGAYGASIGPYHSAGYLSQTLPTSAGQTYLVSAWLWLDDTNDGVFPNEFSAAWNGDTFFDQTNMAATGWTNLQFMVIATDTNTTLSFGFRNDPSYFGFDDVSVQPVPAFQTPTNNGNKIALNFSILAGCQYQLQTSTNLASTNWSNIGSVFFSETNATATLQNQECLPQRFYRAVLLP